MKKSILPVMIAMLQSFKSEYGNLWNMADIPVTKTPTLKDQFGKRKPQGYKKHLRKIGEK